MSACSTSTPAEPSNPAAATAISISSQPQSQTVSSGSSATMSVSGTGSPVTYQWYLGSSGTTSAPIAGATAATYTTPGLTDTTSYWVRLSNSAGAVDSATATVTVTTPAPGASAPPASATAPSITEQPEDQTIVSGQTATLTIETTGSAPMTYQWYVGHGTTSAPIAGTNSTSYTTPALTTTTRYWVRVSNAAGTTDSTTATVTVAPVPPANPAPPPNPTPPPNPPPPQNPQPPTNPQPPANPQPPPAPQPPPPDPGNPAFEDQVLVLVNQHRAVGATCGGTAYPSVPALSMNANLRTAARGHSVDMATLNYFSHVSLDGRTFSQRMQNAGYSGAFPWGENIAAGQPSPQSAVNAWMASPGHCANIMSGSFRVIGVGYAFRLGSTYGHYWTQNFGGS